MIASEIPIDPYEYLYEYRMGCPPPEISSSLRTVGETAIEFQEVFEMGKSMAVSPHLMC